MSDLPDRALREVNRLTPHGMKYVLGYLTWDTPEAVLAAVDAYKAEGPDNGSRCSDSRPGEGAA